MDTSDCSEPMLKAKAQIRDGERLSMDKRLIDAAWAFRAASVSCIEAADALEAMAREQAQRDA